jgi:hypothetical protein
MRAASSLSIHGSWGFHACQECELLTDAYIRALDRQNAANRPFLEAIGLHDTRVLNARFMEGEQCLLVLRDIVLELHHHRRRNGSHGAGLVTRSDPHSQHIEFGNHE